ncbi:MAG: DUF58 domain-containing protein [Saccharofermentanales bacterium]|jgi:hypothetical protein
MTVFLVICLLLILPLLGGASYFGFEVFSILLLTLIALIVVSFIELFYLKRRLVTGTITVDPETPRGEIVNFILPVRLETRWLPLRIKLKARYGSLDKSVRSQKEVTFRDLRAGDELELNFSVAARHTGKLILDEARLEARTFFGLFKFKRVFRSRDIRMMTYVLPLPDRADNTVIRAFRQVDESELAKRRVEERSDEIDTMRVYREGDDIRRIHWQVSSRMNEFIVKQYEAPLAIETHILFDDFTGYSFLDDMALCDKALSLRDLILDYVSGTINWLIQHEMVVSLHTGSSESVTERLRLANDPLRYRRLLAMMEPDTLPTLGEMIENRRGSGSRDRFLLFSSRISEATAASIVELQRKAYQIIYFHFNTDSLTPEEEKALKMLRRADIEVVEVHDQRPLSVIDVIESAGREYA